MFKGYHQDMSPEVGIYGFTGLLRFYSLADMRKYLKDLLDAYQREFDKTANIAGSMLRSEGKKASMEVIMSKGWQKVGEFFINIEDFERAQVEISFQIVNEIKPKVSKVESILKEFDQVEQMPLPQDVTFLLYVKSGIPERIIVDQNEKKPEKFQYTGEYITVL
jgi:hypothetical protein